MKLEKGAGESDSIIIYNYNRVVPVKSLLLFLQPFYPDPYRGISSANVMTISLGWSYMAKIS